MTISYSLPHVMMVRVEVYTILGQKVTTLINRQQQAGTHNITCMDSGRMDNGTCTALPQKKTADSGSSQNGGWC